MNSTEYTKHLDNFSEKLCKYYNSNEVKSGKLSSFHVSYPEDSNIPFTPRNFGLVHEHLQRLVDKYLLAHSKDFQVEIIRPTKQKFEQEKARILGNPKRARAIQSPEHLDMLAGKSLRFTIKVKPK